MKTFSRADDAQLVSELDNIAKERNQADITMIDPSSIDPSAFCMSQESALVKKGERLIRQRCGQLIKLLKSFTILAKYFNLNKKHVQGSVGQLLHLNKFLLAPSVSG